ncbi:MAG: EFR1 family ferrodoxin [Spirochaetales bacterium]|nr:EFR1 family ferrodoxin [Spirochaetales bacterium]
MDKIDIYWFSGSGNTLLLALELEKDLVKAGREVRLLPIENSNPIDIDREAILGIVTAVAEQGTYTLVWDFLNGLPHVHGTGAFLLDSMGMYSGGILWPVKKILKKKGFKTLAAKEILMPNIFYKKKNRSEKEALMKEKGIRNVHKFAGDLLNNKGMWFDIPNYSSLLSLVSKSEKMKKYYQKIIPVTFNEEKCTRCDLCVKLCPVSHITREGDEAPVGSGGTCIHCQRCYAYCPVEAITIGNIKNVPYRALKAGDFLKEITKGADVK